MAIAEAEVRPGRRMTEEEFLRLPDDGRKYELVDGAAKAVPTGWRHDEISINLLALLGKMSSGQDGFRVADENIRAPDVSYTRQGRVPGGRTPIGFGGAAPNMCVEIISPSEEADDMARKLGEYFDSGAEMVWQVFPERRQVVVFVSPSEARTLDAEDTLDAPVLLPGFACRVADLFAEE